MVYIQNVQFFIWSKIGVLNVASFKYSLHKFDETVCISLRIRSHCSLLWT